TKGKRPSLGLPSREVGDVLHHGDEACAVEPLMRAFVGMEKQVEEHPVKGANRAVHHFSDDDGLGPTFGERKLQWAQTQRRDALAWCEVEKISLARYGMIHVRFRGTCQRCRDHLRGQGTDFG